MIIKTVIKHEYLIFYFIFPYVNFKKRNQCKHASFAKLLKDLISQIMHFKYSDI